MSNSVKTLLDAETTTGAGSSLQTPGIGRRTFVATVAGDGAVAADVTIQGSHDGSTWVDVVTIELSGTDAATDGASQDWGWAYLRAEVDSISGTDAAVTCTTRG